MAMEITNNYSNYVASYTETTKKADNKAASEAKISSKDKVQTYYEQLCRKFPQININSNRGIAGGDKNNIVLNLSMTARQSMMMTP